MADNASGQSTTDGVQSAPADQIDITGTAEELARRLRDTSHEAKKYRQAVSELKASLDAHEREKMEAQGQFQEMAKKERERAEQAEQAMKQSAGKFGYKILEMAVETEASKLGCLDTKALLKLTDVTKIDIDEEFNVDRNGVKMVLEQMAKEKPYLFQKSAVNPKDLPPASGNDMFKSKTMDQMSPAEKIAMATKMMIGNRR